jgi:hypothetical protein
LAKPTATTKEDDAGFEHDVVHSNAADAIEAVQSTLGLNPEGAFATVDARIVDLETPGKPVQVLVRNATGSTLSKGTVVYTSGANGTHVQVTKAQANSEATSARTLGFVADNIANGADGFVIDSGPLEGVDTSGKTAGDIVYLSPTVAGGWTTTKPVAPNHLVYLGVVTRVNVSNGSIFVKVQNGYELDEIHDVLLVSETNGDLLKYDSATGLWKNAAQSTLTVSQSQVTNLTTDLAGKVGTSRTVSTTAPLSGGGDLSANRTLTIADGTTAVKGAVQLTDSTGSTSTTTAATPNSVKSAYDLATTANTAAGTAQTTANAAVPKSTVTTTGDLIVATGSAAVTRLAAGTSGQVLTANGAGVAPTYQAAAGDGKVVVQTNSHTPNNATGNNADMMITAYDPGTGGGVLAKVVGPKSAGAWPASDAINSGGDRVFLPLRSKTMKHADLVPGWRMDFDTTWATGTVPSDLTRDGTFGGAWYSSAAGTYAGISRYRQAAGAPLAFFSGQFTITTLPESGRFFIFGNGISSAGWYGYGLRIESTGAATIRLVDPFIGPTDLALATGMTVAVNDTIVFERFGWRLTAYKTSGTGRTLLGPENATATNRPMNALIDPTRGAFYADLYSGSSFGLTTNSASVRVSNVYFAG